MPWKMPLHSRKLLAVEEPALNWVYGSFLVPAIGKAGFLRAGVETSVGELQVFLDIGQWCHQKGQCLPQMLRTSRATQLGLRHLPFPHVTSCCCFTLGLSQSHGGFIGTHRAGLGF